MSSIFHLLKLPGRWRRSTRSARFVVKRFDFLHTGALRILMWYDRLMISFGGAPQVYKFFRF